jgi:hypothetical protein
MILIAYNPHRENSAQAKLGRLSSKVYEDAQADTHAQAQLQAQVQAEAEAQALLQAGPFARPTGNVSLHQNAPDNWKFAVVGCGSNGFGQLFVNGNECGCKGVCGCVCVYVCMCVCVWLGVDVCVWV